MFRIVNPYNGIIREFNFESECDHQIIIWQIVYGFTAEKIILL